MPTAKDQELYAALQIAYRRGGLPEMKIVQVRIESGITPEKALETDSAKGVEDRVVLLDAMKAGGQKAFDQAWEKLGLSEKSASPGSNRS